jgi:hypothetical protein
VEESTLIDQLDSRKISIISIVTVAFVIAACFSSERVRVAGTLERIRQVRTGQTEFHTRYSRYGSLQDLSTQKLIPADIADGRAWDYSFSLVADSMAYRIEAVPNGEDGICFFMDETGIIRSSYSPVIRATRESEAIGNQ